jgi:hypothetical protein
MANIFDSIPTEAQAQAAAANGAAPPPAPEEVSPKATTAVIPSTPMVDDLGNVIPDSQGLTAGHVGAALADIGKGLLEAPGAMLRGGEKAVNETVKFVGSIAQQAIIAQAEQELGVKPDKVEPIGNVVPDAVTPAEPESVTGHFIEGVTQFAVGMAGAGKFTTAAGLAKGAIKATVDGAASMGAAFAPHEENLSNLVQKYPSLQNPVTDFLSSKEDDGEAFGRFKKALEGLALGGATEGLALGVRSLKLAKAGKVEEAAAVAEEAKAAAENPKPTPPEQLELPFTGGGAKPDSVHESVAPTEGARAEQAAAKETAKATPPVKKFMSDDAVSLYEEGVRRETALGPDANIDFGMATAGIDHNFGLIKTPEDIKTALNVMSVVREREMIAAKGGNADGVRTMAAVERNKARLAEITGSNPEVLVQNMDADLQSVKHLDSKLLAYGDFVVSLVSKTQKLASLVAEGNQGQYGSLAEAQLAYAQHVKLMGYTNDLYKGIKTNTARTLNALKQGAEVSPEMLANVDEYLAGGTKGIEALARRMVLAGNDPAKIAATVQKGFFGKTMDVLNTYFINSILSHPSTHVVNVGTSLVKGLGTDPMEKIIGGALRLNGGQMLEGASQYVYVVKGIKDVLKLTYNGLAAGDLGAIKTGLEETSAGKAVKALKQNEPVLDPRNQTLENRGEISMGNGSVVDSIAEGDPLAALVNAAGRTIDLPSRFMTSEDELVKQLVYRSKVYGRAVREAYDGGMPVAAHAERRLAGAFDADGKATDLVALQAAREATFTQSLGRGTLGRGLQDLTERHPYLKQIAPFVRTPTNIMRYTWEHTPIIGLAQKEMREAIMAGGEARSDAIAKQVMGGGYIAAALAMVHDGTVTGSGPVDPDIRKLKEATGWQANSIVTTDADGKKTYTSINRADPYGMFLGLIADMSQFGHYLPEGEYEKFAAGVTVAVARNLQNKSYLQGMTNFLDAITPKGNDETALEKSRKFIQNWAAGYVPSALRVANDDPYMREARSIADAMMKKVPGSSYDVDPERNHLGQKLAIKEGWGPDWLSPFAQTTEKNDPVLSEMARLAELDKKQFSKPSKHVGQIDLTDPQWKKPGEYSAYDRLQQLVGEIPGPGGLTLHDRLAAAINSPLYKALTDGQEKLPGSRIEHLQGIVGMYHELAKQHLYAGPRPENAALGAAFKKQERDQWQAKKPVPLVPAQ